MTRKLLITFVLAATGFASVAAALGLGSIDSQSTLNQPLQARIELVSADPDEIDRITAQLASSEAFERAGLERPFFLSRLDFDVVREGDSVFLEVTTDSAIKEPFLDFLVEVEWPNGRLLREYTLLLDPPTYQDDVAPSVAAGDGAPETGAGDDGAQAGTGEAERGGGEGASATPAAAAATTPAAQPDTGSGGGEYGPVQATDTLYSIAEEMRPSGVNINQTMLALLRANPDAFIDGNINALRRGAILRMPDRQELTRLSTAEANAEVREQMARWQERRSAPTAPAETELAEAAQEGDEAADADDGGEAGEAGEADAEVAAADAEVAAADAGEAADGEATADEADFAGGEGELRLVAPEESEGVDATTSLAEADLEATPDTVSRLQDQLVVLEESNADLQAENEDLRGQVEGLRSELDELQRMINVRLSQELPLDGSGEETAGETGLDAPIAAGDAADPEATEEVGGADEAAAADDDDEAADTEMAAGAEDAADGEGESADEVMEQADSDEAVAAADTGASADGDGEATDSDGAGSDDEVAGAQDAEQAADSDGATAQGSAESPATASFLEMMLADTRLLTYAGGGIIALLLLLMLVQRRRRAAAEAAGADDGLPEPGVAPMAAAGGAAAAAAAGDQESGISAEAGDPLEEAELYMAYGRADQAQEVLDRALGEEPDNIDLRVRLLEVLAERGDRAGFEAEAQVLHTQVPTEEDPRWQRIAGLGHELAPEHPLFGGDGEASAAAGAVTPPADSDPAATAEAAPDGVEDDLTESDALAEDTDFRLDADAQAGADAEDEAMEPAPAASGDEERLAPAGDELAAVDAGNDAAEDDAAEDDGELGDLEFDLGDFSFDDAEDTADSGHQARAGGDDGLEFSLEEPAREDEVDRDDPLDFSLDEELEPADSVDTAPGRRAANADEDDDDLDFGDFSLDREPSGGSDDEGADIDGLDEVGTKLDLARAYMDMGDTEGARSLLDEVSEEGNPAQKQEAEELLARTG